MDTGLERFYSDMSYDSDSDTDLPPLISGDDIRYESDTDYSDLPPLISGDDIRLVSDTDYSDLPPLNDLNYETESDIDIHQLTYGDDDLNYDTESDMPLIFDDLKYDTESDSNTDDDHNTDMPLEQSQSTFSYRMVVLDNDMTQRDNDINIDNIHVITFHDHESYMEYVNSTDINTYSDTYSDSDSDMPCLI